jgi:hypothetical protein
MMRGVWNGVIARLIGNWYLALKRRMEDEIKKTQWMYLLVGIPKMN